MIKKEDLALYQVQVQTDVTFTAFMTAVVLFFTGLLLTKFESFDILIKVPIAFLIISTFGFLYSSLILSNATSEIVQRKLEKAERHVLYGYIISEFIGVYLLIISVPLVINVITTDLFLRIVTLFSSLGGFAFYHFSHFSIIEKHFEKGYRILSVIIIVLGLLLFLTQVYEQYFVFMASIVLVIILFIAYYSIKKLK